MKAGRPLHVVLCSAGELYGGVERFLQDLSRHLSGEPGVSVKVLLFSKGALQERLESENLSVALFPWSKWNPFAVFRMALWMRRNQADIVHANGYKAGLLCGLAARLAGVKVLKTEHGNLEPSVFWSQLKMRLYLFLDRALARFLADGVAFVSSSTRDALASAYKNMKSEVIYNGVDPASFEAGPGARAPDYPEGSFHVGIVGRLAPVKGHVYMLEAMRALSDLPVHLHVFGDGPSREPLARYCRENGLELRVSFEGFKADIHDHMRSMELIVVPSLREEFPYVPLEASVLGVPFIASRVGGIPEFFRSGEDCLLVEPASARDLAAAVRELCQDPSKSKRLASSAMEKVKKDLSARRMAKRYLSFYERLT